MSHEKEDQFDAKNQKEWFSKKRQELIAANMQGDEEAVKIVTSQVAEIYGREYAQQWRLIVLEEHAQRRINESFSMGFDDDLR